MVLKNLSFQTILKIKSGGTYNSPGFDQNVVLYVNHEGEGFQKGGLKRWLVSQQGGLLLGFHLYMKADIFTIAFS